MGVELVFAVLLELVTQGHEFIDFGDDAVLFGEWGKRIY
jgi:hypothetical protein